MLQFLRARVGLRRYSIPWHGREVRVAVAGRPLDPAWLGADLKLLREAGPTLGALSRELIWIAQAHGMIVEFAPDIRRGVFLNREVIAVRLLPSPFA